MGYRRTHAGALTLLLPMFLAASDAGWEERALITAKPRTVTYASEASEESMPQRVIHGALFDVELADIEVVYGRFPGPEAKVTMMLSQADVLDPHEAIYLLLDVGDRQPRVLYWGVPRTVACIPREFVSAPGMEKDFRMEDGRSGQLCTDLQWFR